MEAETTTEELNQKLQEQKLMDTSNDPGAVATPKEPENEMVQNKASNVDGDGGDSNSTAAVHPLCSAAVMPRIMGCLKNLRDLKVARRVCTVWNQAASPYFYQKAVACCPTNAYLHKQALLEFGKKSRFENYYFHDLPWSENIFSDFAKVTGENIKMLDLTYCETIAKRFSIRFLKDFLQGCPNLEELRCYCASDAFMSETERFWTSKEKKYDKMKKLTFGGMNYISLRILQDLFNSCPELKSFNFDTIGSYSNTDEYVTSILNLATTGKIDLSKLEELNVYGETRIISSTQAMLQIPQINFKALTSLHICLYWRTDPSAIQRMFEHLSGTLKEFKVTNCPYTADFYNPLIIPTCMTKLEKIEVLTANNGFFLGPIASAVKLPSLKIFNMHRYPTHELGLSLFAPGDEGYFCNFDECWSNLENIDANWHTNRSTSLELIRLPIGLTNPDIFTQIVTVFPNLKNMKIENPSPEVMTAIFTHCTNLERLSIRFIIYPMNIDEALTGLKPSWCKTMRKKKQFIIDDPRQVIYNSPGLKDMKKLKYFELRQYQHSHRLTEISLYHGFIYLTQAVQLDLQSCTKFSKKSIRDLKKTLSPTCFVNIQDDTPEDAVIEKMTGKNSRYWIDKKRYF